MMPEQPSNASSPRADKFRLVLDVGTTGIKAFVFDEDERIIARAYKTISKSMPKMGWVEQNPAEIISTSITVLRAAIGQAGLHASHIESLGITNQRETTIAWSNETGQPLYPAIVWEDTRTHALCWWLRLRAKSSFIREQTGLSIIPYFSATKMQWLFNHVPAVRTHAEIGDLRIGTIDTWLLWNLSQERSFKTDYTNASRTLLFNIRTLQWDAALCDLFKIPRDILPTVAPSRSEFGTVRKEILGAAIPIRAVCADQQASMFAAGHAPGTTKITYGTGGFIMQLCEALPTPQKHFFTTVVPRHDGGAAYALEAKVGKTGIRVSEHLKHPNELLRVFREIATQINEYVQRLPHKPERIIADGGITNNREMLHIQSTVSGILVYPQQTPDGTALGIARLLTDNKTN